MKQKNYAIDSVRFLAAFAVICIHYFYAKDKQLTLVVNQCARFAVPFFFVASGYFLAEKLKNNDKPAVYFQFFKKLIFLYLAWQFIHFLVPPHGSIYLWGWKKTYIDQWNRVMMQRWDFIIFRGWSQHLWFFLSLALTSIYFLIFRTKRIYLMVSISFVLYVIGALTKSYAKSAIGVDVRNLGFPKDFNTNNLIFFSALPFSMGVLLSVKS